MAYTNVEDRRKYAREYHLRRMAEDPQYAEDYRAKKNAYRKQRYDLDPEFRERIKAHARKEGAKEETKTARKLRVRERAAAGLVWPSVAKKKTDPIFKAQQAEKRREERFTQPGKFRKQHLKKCYGMTVEQYERKLYEQNGKCAICLGDNGGKKLFVDHDHNKPKGEGNRWLLCGGCNTMIGHAKESPAILRKAADMLELYHGA